MPELEFHAEAFANLGIEPEIDDAAFELLRRRETELGFQFPASVRELFQYREAERLLTGGEDLVVPLETLGSDYSPEHPVMCIVNDYSGNWSAFIHIDGSDDPEVRFFGDENEWEEDERGMPAEIIGPFSAFVREQTEVALKYEAWLQRVEKERQERWRNRSLWTRLRGSYDWLTTMLLYLVVVNLVVIYPVVKRLQLDTPSALAVVLCGSVLSVLFIYFRSIIDWIFGGRRKNNSKSSYDPLRGLSEFADKPQSPP